MHDVDMERVDTGRVATTVTDNGAGKEPALGVGRLARAFRPHYEQAGTPIRRTAGDAGTGSARDYETGDADSAAGLPGGPR
jgi:hypothetical protein